MQATATAYPCFAPCPKALQQGKSSLRTEMFSSKKSSSNPLQPAHDKPSPTGSLGTFPLTAGGSCPTRFRKSSPTSESICACSLARSMHLVHASLPCSVLLSCLARMTLKASTSPLAHLTQALIMGGGKQPWKHPTVFLMMVKYTKDICHM